jgi:hypothetical protein
MKDLPNQVRTAVSISDPANWAFFLVVLAGVLALAVLASSQRNFPSLVAVDWAQQGHCRSAVDGGNPNAPALTAYVHASFQGNALCDELSTRDRLASTFSQVHAQWTLRPEDLRHAIAQAQLDLLLLRREEITASQQFVHRLYRQIAFYPSYEVFLIARDHRPAATTEYLASHRIGLLQNSSSWSGYIVPMQHFHEAGVEPRDMTVRYYPDHRALREGLHRGEVDVISSYWDEFQAQQHPEWQTHRIGHVAEGMSWFLKESAYEEPEIRCTLIEALRSLADRTSNPYFADLRFTKASGQSCDDR